MRLVTGGRKPSNQNSGSAITEMDAIALITSDSLALNMSRKY